MTEYVAVAFPPGFTLPPAPPSVNELPTVYGPFPSLEAAQDGFARETTPPFAPFVMFVPLARPTPPTGTANTAANVAHLVHPTIPGQEALHQGEAPMRACDPATPFNGVPVIVSPGVYAEVCQVCADVVATEKAER